MLKVNALAIVISACLMASAAAAATIPNAQDPGALRLGPMAVVGFQKWNGGWRGDDVRILATGAAFWAQYDASWFGFDMRLGGHFGSDHGVSGSVRWENEYNLFLIKGKFRPYLTPAAGVCYTSVNGVNSHWEAVRPVFAFYFGVRLNSPTSPFYMTFDGGYKYVDDQPVATIRNRYFFGLSDTVALRTGFEAAVNFDSNDAYGIVDIGPSFSF